LIKVFACPINPSDLFFMKGEYDQFDLFKIHYPSSPGWEGSGIVVKNGGGVMGWRAMGKRVAFTRAVHGKNEFLTGGCY
jgi:NADPH:quinone reductase-like Zn-dependent oxidoreductase